MTEEVKKGWLGNWLLDKETIDKINKIIASVDTNKIKMIFDMIEEDPEGWLSIKIDLKVRK